jgi:hypothetical protein
MKRFLTSVGALALAAIAGASPAHAVPRANLGACLNRCQETYTRGLRACQDSCNARYGRYTNAPSVRKAKPIGVTGGPVRPKQPH